MARNTVLVELLCSAAVMYACASFDICRYGNTSLEFCPMFLLLAYIAKLGSSEIFHFLITNFLVLL